MQNLSIPGRLLLLGIFLLGPRPSLQGQHHDADSIQKQSILESEREGSHGTIARAKDFFAYGTITGHLRNYFMSTFNRGDLTDYYANAIGGTMGFRSPDFYGFEFGTAGIFTYKAFSSDLNKVDPATGEVAFWEHELFDVIDTDNFNDLDRLESLYLRYSFSKGYITYGKMEIEDTPLMNRSDQRMNAFSFKGIWLHYALDENNRFHFTWIDRISPRGVVEWVDFHEGIGLSDQGFQPDGTEADYFEHVDSDGLAMLGYLGQRHNFSLQFYQWYLDNLSYTSWLGLEYRKANWSLGLQGVLQFPDAHQRDLEYDQRYIQPGEHGQVLSGQVKYDAADWHLRAAFTEVFNGGRFLFPRELGRDNFYTSLPRSRLEGFGDTHVLTLGGEYVLTRDGLTAGLDYTRLWGPQTGTFTYNKYDLDAYWQVNARLHYAFGHFFDGLSIDMLYVYKQNRNDTSPGAIFNRSNYHQFNLVTTFVFN